jgi:hypothetical protein
MSPNERASQSTKVAEPLCDAVLVHHFLSSSSTLAPNQFSIVRSHSGSVQGTEVGVGTIESYDGSGMTEEDDGDDCDGGNRDGVTDDLAVPMLVGLDDETGDEGPDDDDGMSEGDVVDELVWDEPLVGIVVVGDADGDVLVGLLVVVLVLIVVLVTPVVEAPGRTAPGVVPMR